MPLFARSRRVVLCGLAAATAAVALALLPGSAGARAPIRSCGNTTAGNGLLIGDVTARRVSCRTARRVARAVPGRCGQASSCTVSGFSCLVARAAPELRFARCSRPGRGDELYKAIRFDYGS